MKLKFKFKASDLECNFKNCAILHLQAWWMLLVLLFMKHTFKTLFVISILLNCYLAWSCSRNKVTADANDHKAYVLEQKVDSLRIMVGEK